MARTVQNLIDSTVLPEDWGVPARDVERARLALFLLTHVPAEDAEDVSLDSPASTVCLAPEDVIQRWEWTSLIPPWWGATSGHRETLVRVYDALGEWSETDVLRDFVAVLDDSVGGGVLVGVSCWGPGVGDAEAGLRVVRHLGQSEVMWFMGQSGLLAAVSVAMMALKAWEGASGSLGRWLGR